jgi:hypothetical protein
MPDATYNTKIYEAQGGDRLVVVSTGYILRSVASVAAAGTVQGDAAAITCEVNAVTASDGTKGVVLPTAEVGMQITVKNTVAAVLKVYPASGGTINALSANAAISMAASTSATFVATSTTQWYTVPLVPS